MDVTIDKKLKDLWKLQQIDSRLDNLRAVLGELPMEVADLEDDIAGLQTRVSHISTEIAELNQEISNKRNAIKDFERLIEKYDDQLNNIKNSREYDAINKEKEIAGLEIMSAEKRMREYGKQIELKEETLANTQNALDSRNKDLEFKKAELTEIEKENADEIEKIISSNTFCGLQAQTKFVFWNIIIGAIMLIVSSPINLWGAITTDQYN